MTQPTNPQPEEPFIQVVYKDLLKLLSTVQRRSKLYTDGVLIVAMSRVMRDLSRQYDEKTSAQVQQNLSNMYKFTSPSHKAEQIAGGTELIMNQVVQSYENYIRMYPDKPETVLSIICFTVEHIIRNYEVKNDNTI